MHRGAAAVHHRRRAAPPADIPKEGSGESLLRPPRGAGKCRRHIRLCRGPDPPGRHGMPARASGAAGAGGEPDHRPGREVPSGAADDGVPEHDRDLFGAPTGGNADAGRSAERPDPGAVGRGDCPAGRQNPALNGHFDGRYSLSGKRLPGNLGILPKKHKRFCNKMSKGTCNVRKSCV